MRKSLLLLSALLLFVAIGAPIARADDIWDVDISGLTFNGASVCGPTGTSVCTETLTTSFVFDYTANVEDGLAATGVGAATGDLGVAPYFGDFCNNGGCTEIDFDWGTTSFSIMVNLKDPSVNGAQLICQAGSICSTDFPGGPTPGANTFSAITATEATPEPGTSSFLLVGIGLLGLVSRKRIA